MFEIVKESSFHSTFKLVDIEIDRILEDIESNLILIDNNEKFILQFVLRELFNNAVEHGNKMVESKLVKYKLDVSDTSLHIEIMDEGKGFDPDLVIKGERHETMDRDRSRGLSTLFDLGFTVKTRNGVLFASHDFKKSIKNERLVENMNFRIENGRAILELISNPVAANIKSMVESMKTSLDSIESCDCVVIDLKASESIDSMGITFLIGIYKTLKAKEKTVILKNVSEPMKNLFKIMKLDEIFVIEQ